MSDLSHDIDTGSRRALRVLSLGAGVQSTALLLMGIHGEFGDRPDVAIFADTRSEPAGVYRHLDWLREFCAGIGFPLLTVTAGDLGAVTLAMARGEGTRFASLPFFVSSPTRRGSGMIRRQCTSDYKIVPIRRAMRSLVGKRGQVELWMGISADEWARMKDSDRQWITHRYPLVERRISRQGCLDWLAGHGYPKPPKSACTFCPFHSNAVWREMKQTDPVSWREAVEFDAQVRHLPRIAGEVYLHSSLKPLDEVYLGEDQIDLWANSCEGGHCGV